MLFGDYALKHYPNDTETMAYTSAPGNWARRLGKIKEVPSIAPSMQYFENDLLTPLAHDLRILGQWVCIFHRSGFLSQFVADDAPNQNFQPRNIGVLFCDADANICDDVNSGKCTVPVARLLC